MGRIGDFSCAALVAVMLLLGWACGPSSAASYRTQNFLVGAATADVAEQVGLQAERYRRDLALEWLGQAMPNWSAPCPITVQIGPIGSGGVTSFMFSGGEVFGWRM